MVSPCVHAEYARPPRTCRGHAAGMCEYVLLNVANVCYHKLQDSQKMLCVPICKMACFPPHGSRCGGSTRGCSDVLGTTTSTASDAFTELCTWSRQAGAGCRRDIHLCSCGGNAEIDVEMGNQQPCIVTVACNAAN